MKKLDFKAFLKGGIDKISSAGRKCLYGLALALCGAVMMQSCKTTYLPSTSTTVNVKDSTVLNIIDSVRVTERSRYKDYGDLLKVLVIDGQRSHMKSWIDTTKNIINGELVEDPVEEHTKIVYRDREVLKDTTIYKEIPKEIPVVKEVKYIPRFYKFFTSLGIILTVVLGLLGFMKLKKNGFFLKILKLFKK